ncbi:M15 family metallopeptidase [Bacillaceae bacterium SIJ1]|uniref:M15 family metallopeptidase n=1 Tax=Litoribacterium kuwaitense TaxID=1398745 RepID=UPI0013EE2240|nr:M15 family metallopeptidase [Litoribacterium kuwaitense]NGP45762.1 M15 family metallopeptidase [Litoribacterium kuwaitense]
MKFPHFLILIGVIVCALWMIKESVPSSLNYETSSPIEKMKDKEPPQGLHPVVEQKKNELVEKAKNAGIEILITDDFRSFAEQDRLYAQGRTTEGAIVTNAEGGESLHNYGLAIDFALRTASGDVIWDLEFDGNQNGEADWMEVVAIAKALEFEWGGDWTSIQDYPHFQYIPEAFVFDES